MKETTRKNQQTKTMITVAHGDDCGLEVDRELGLVWYTICNDHGQCTAHATRELASRFAASPLDWCEVCNGNEDSY